MVSPKSHDRFTIRELRGIREHSFTTNLGFKYFQKCYLLHLVIFYSSVVITLYLIYPSLSCVIFIHLDATFFYKSSVHLIRVFGFCIPIVSRGGSLIQRPFTPSIDFLPNDVICILLPVF